MQSYGYTYRHPIGERPFGATIGGFVLSTGERCRWELWYNGNLIHESDLRENLLAMADALAVGIEHNKVTISGDQIRCEYPALLALATINLHAASLLVDLFESV